MKDKEDRDMFETMELQSAENTDTSVTDIIDVTSVSDKVNLKNCFGDVILNFFVFVSP